MNDPADLVKNLQPKHKFLVGIDSDGCAFDTMEVKHKECFIPNTINEWNLQAVSKYAREAAEFVNLYSKWRGINRFPALLMTFDLLAERAEVRKRGVSIPDVPNLRNWTKTESKLANPALEAAVQATGHADLAQALRWSKGVNESVEKVVRGVPPFPFVRETLAKLADYADVIVVSATPGEALAREWHEHHIAQHAAAICGQEVGTKKQMLGWLAGRYAAGHVLMIGDAPGDQDAARANGALFCPINPGGEDASWERFYNEGLGKFIRGEFVGSYERSLVAEFDRYLPDTPPWRFAESRTAVL
jgi:phosphoglycolate phosphatase-like HAD superfamily hydrolase